MADTSVHPLPLVLAGDSPAKELISRCVHCGLCLPTCPTYEVLGVEMDSPRGRIRLMKTVLEGRIAPEHDAYEEHMYVCLDCRACETACPSGVEFGKLVEGARAQVERSRRRSPVARLVRWLAYRQLLPHHRRLAAFARMGHLARRSGADRALAAIGRLIPPARGLSAMLALVPDRAPASTPLPAVVPAIGPRRGRVALFQGCVMRAAFADTNAATARVLARNGIEVLVPEVQTCCGALHVHAGDPDGARELAKRNITALEGLDVDAIVVNAAGCGANLKEYGWLFRADPAWAARAERFSARVRDATEHLADVGLVAKPGPLPLTAAYDDPCHLIHGQKISEQPRQLLEAIPELRLVPLGEADWCCGSAGVYNVTQPEISRQLLHRKIEHVKRADPQVLVTANPGCQMQLEAGIRQAGLDIEVVHLVDLLDRAYAGA